MYLSYAFFCDNINIQVQVILCQLSMLESMYVYTYTTNLILTFDQCEPKS